MGEGLASQHCSYSLYYLSLRAFILAAVVADTVERVLEARRLRQRLWKTNEAWSPNRFRARELARNESGLGGKAGLAHPALLPLRQPSSPCLGTRSGLA